VARIYGGYRNVFRFDGTATVADFMDNQGNLSIQGATFVLGRVATNTACAQVRALAF
jgi:hypothetical protein